MCGIIGVAGTQPAAPFLVEGLRRLEYRGYDSAGLAIITSEGVRTSRAVGEVSQLAALEHPDGVIGIGHTRWATHGAPTTDNAHPHTDCKGHLALVHNGIVENHQALREKLEANGHVFKSQTDTEVVAHLIESLHEGDLVAAVRRATALIEGSFALVVLDEARPDTIVVARQRSPLLIGLGEGANYVASDATPLLSHTKQVVFLEDGEVAEVRADGVTILSRDGEVKPLAPTTLDWSLESAEKSGFEHFMLKEIHEIPDALHEVMRGRLPQVGSTFDVQGNLSQEALRSAKRIVVLACGTSYYAGMVGKSILEQLAGVPVEVHLGSEYRYAPSMNHDDTIAILVSQSGETADTLEALRRAKQLGCRTLAFVNVVGSSLAREADGVFYLRAGPEIGVASTKAFINMLGGFYLLGLHLGACGGAIVPAEVKRLSGELRRLPRLARETLEVADLVDHVGGEFFVNWGHAFYLGRQVNYGLAMEGALKLKEISYIHAEGYAAGELKHGPLALLQPGFPVVALLPKGDPTYGVMASNIGEVRARSARVLGIIMDNDPDGPKHVDETILVPATDPLYFPVPACIVMYLLAYHAAKARDCPIDKPRNLAKSVTVE